ncbi:hypothetical protein M0R45_002142 [Rubus argutus]|uniref:Uncharacterized protein n=1 Tax=Rubus argutus TaxID=59490 RepID=A0AAW1VDR6_RUBAR
MPRAERCGRKEVAGFAKDAVAVVNGLNRELFAGSSGIEDRWVLQRIGSSTTMAADLRAEGGWCDGVCGDGVAREAGRNR